MVINFQSHSYNAIHDPTISMVALSIQIEGALDILSATQLMSLAQNTSTLPASILGACMIFSLLELLNAAQSFALQIILSGGHDYTPSDLVSLHIIVFNLFISHNSISL